MDAKQWRLYEKAAWGPGPWQDEPDLVLWADDATGYVCLMHRARIRGNWCGYVVLPAGHPWYGRPYGALQDVDVHGSLTYAGGLGDMTRYLPDHDGWCVGFACDRCTDYVPGEAALVAQLAPEAYADKQAAAAAGPEFLRELYRDVVYVRTQVLSLAAQARVAADAMDPASMGVGI